MKNLNIELLNKYLRDRGFSVDNISYETHHRISEPFEGGWFRKISIDLRISGYGVVDMGNDMGNVQDKKKKKRKIVKRTPKKPKERIIL